jgi:PAS domain S-box-containing protein
VKREHSIISPAAPASPAWAAYLLAVACVFVAWLGREGITPAIGATALPFIFFFPGVVIASWYGGVGPGILATILSALTANWFFIDPPHSLAIRSAYDLTALSAFLLSCTFIVCALGKMHVTRRALKFELEERAKIQSALAREKELLTVTLSSIGDGVIATDAQGAVTFLNPEAQRLTGWSAADALGRPLPEVFHIINERTRQPAENLVEKVFRTGSVVALANHTVLIARNRLEIPIDDSAAPIRQADGSLAGVVLVFRDVTEQRKAQQARAQMAAVAEFCGDAVFTKNLDGIIQSWNASAERIFGYRADEIIGRPVTVLFPPDRLDEEIHILGQLRQGKACVRLETIRVAKGGRQLNVSVSVSPIKDAEDHVIGVSKIIHDTTDLVAARQALERQKEILSTTLSSIGDAVIVTDTEGRVTFLNAEAQRLTGWHEAEAAGKPLSQIFRIVNETTRQPVESPADKVFRLGTVVGLANHTILIAKDGRETPIDDSGAPIRMPNGPLFGVVLVFRDFTQHRETAAKLSSHAVHLEKLVAERTARLNETIGDLETFSYSIVHDLRAPLRAMSNFATLLADECRPSSPAAQNYVQRINTAAERMDRLIQEVLNYGKLTRSDFALTPVDVAALLRGIIETYPAFQPPHAQIEILGSLPPVLGSEAALTQCISNLLGNAVKFVEPGTAPHVRIWAESRDEVIRLCFQDNGIGIESSSHQKIFQMFQRLSKRYEGTGVGLTIVKKAAEKMGGRVGLESEPGQGSTFWLELLPAPLVPGSGTAPAPAGENPSPS